MEINEFFESNSFHDSWIESIDFNEDKKDLILKIDFCNAMQDWYKKERMEKAEIKTLKFVDVEEYNMLEDVLVESDSILKINVTRENLIEVIFYNEAMKEINILAVKCEKVLWES